MDCGASPNKPWDADAGSMPEEIFAPRGIPLSPAAFQAWMAAKFGSPG